MSKRHTELMAAIGMAGGIVQTYRSQTIHVSKGIEKRLNQIDQCVSMAVHTFGRVGQKNVMAIAEKIDKANNDKYILGRARSIVTFIDYATWLLESTLMVTCPPA